MRGFGAGALAGALLAGVSGAAMAQDCDRQCLIEATDQYVAALIAGDPSTAPLADNLATVENVTRIEPGQGLWESAVSGPTEFAIHVPDEINQSAGYIAMITRMAPPLAPQGSSPEEIAALAANAELEEQPTLIALRLQFENGEIVEAEHLVTGIREQNLGNLRTLRPGLLTEFPEGERQSHAELIRIGEAYYDALELDDGDLFPFAPDCERRENGFVTAGGSWAAGAPGPDAPPQPARDCHGQMSSGTFKYITALDNRRVFAADPVTGLVMGLSHFRHPMDNLPYDVINTDGSTSERTSEDFSFAPFDLPAAHISKVYPDGLVREIEAMGFQVPYQSPTGWE